MISRRLVGRALAALLLALTAGASIHAQTSAGSIAGSVRDQTGGALPGVTIELLSGRDVAASVQSDGAGRFRLDGVTPGIYTLSFKLLNFGEQQRPNLRVTAGNTTTADAVLSLALSADVVVTGKRSFVNLADAEDPAQNLVSIAQSASQGAITARQLEVRPVMRAGEVLETVPGVIITQHSGEGKANRTSCGGSISITAAISRQTSRAFR
jgi:hypothetical protein